MSQRELLAIVPRIRAADGNARGRMDLFEIAADSAQAMGLDALAADLFREQAALAADPKNRRDDTLAMAGWLSAHALIAAGRYAEALPRYEALDRYYRESQEEGGRGNAGFLASHAYLLALAASPAAAAKLAEARAALPEGLPATHPLPRLMDYIAALIEGAGRDSAATRRTLAAVNAAYHRPTGEPIALPIAPLWF